jgi:hypothetical protein
VKILTWKFCTRLYDVNLEQRRDKKSFGKINVFSQKKELQAIKAEFEDFKAPASQVLQNVVFALDRVIFTKHKRGDRQAIAPKFRSSKYFLPKNIRSLKHPLM